MRSATRAILLIVGLLLVGLGPVVLADPIAYVPLIMVVFVVLLSYLCLKLACRALKVDESALARSCERGSVIGLKISLHNNSWVPIARLEASFFISDILGGFDVVSPITSALGPRSHVNLDFNARFAHLGTYTAGIDHVIVHDLLGLFSHRIELSYHDPVDVRPRLFDVGDPDLAHVTLEESNNMFQPIASDDTDYAGVRDYQYGDPLKTVHWNLSGRDPEGRLYTRLFEVYAEPGLAVVIDSFAPDFAPEELMSAFDALVESAASISDAARRLGVDAELRYVNREGEPSMMHLEKSSDADMLVHTMMPATPHATQASHEIVEVLMREARSPRGKGNVAYCASCLDDEVADALIEMRMRRRNPMFFMALPRELDSDKRKELTDCLARLAQAGVPYYLVEANEQLTELVGS